MQTPQEYNTWFMQRFSMKRLNIKCPNCSPDVEMVETSPGVQMLSYPAQISIYCPSCNYKTNIYVD